MKSSVADGHCRVDTVYARLDKGTDGFVVLA